MKKLTAILCAGLLTTSIFGFESDRFKYIPETANVLFMDINGNGIPDLYWHDKNQDGIVQDNEIFFDLNEDGIPDISYEEIIKMYRSQDELEYKLAPMVMK